MAYWLLNILESNDRCNSPILMSLWVNFSWSLTHSQTTKKANILLKCYISSYQRLKELEFISFSIVIQLHWINKITMAVKSKSLFRSMKTGLTHNNRKLLEQEQQCKESNLQYCTLVSVKSVFLRV